MGRAWSELTTSEKNALIGNFVDGGERVDFAPSDDDVFPICAGSWPNHNPAAVPWACEFCSRPVGISPRGLAMHMRNTARPVICSSCLEGLQLLAEMLGL